VCMEDTQIDYERRFSLFPFTLCTFLPLYTSRGLWKCVSVHRKFSYHETHLCHLCSKEILEQTPSSFPSCSTYFVHPVSSYEEVCVVYFPC
jgi:hypothetical protein